MKPILILLILLFIIGQFDIHNQQFEADNPLDRMKRDAPSIKSKAAIVVDQHMKLAKLLNAIYLQMQLSNEKIDDFDVIAGIWEIDRSAIEKLVSLKVNALAESMSSLEKMVNEFPNGLDRIANVEEISKKLDSVKEITPEKREALRLAMKDDSVPGFLKTGDFPEWDFKENLAIKVLEKLETVRSMTNFDPDKTEKLSKAMVAIYFHLNKLRNWITTVNEEQQKTIETLVQGYEAAIDVKNKVTELQELVTLLTEAEKVLVHVQSLKDIKGVSGMQVESKNLNTALLQLHQKSNMSVAPAFSSNPDLASFETGLKDEWIGSLIAGGKDLGLLESFLDDIASIAKTFTPVNQNMKTLMTYDLIDELKLVSRSIDEISKFQQNSNHLNLTSLPSCNESPDLTDVKDALETSQQLYKSITPLDEVANGIDRLSDGKAKILSIQQKLKVFTVTNKGCETLFSFDIEPFKDFNDVPDTITWMKEEKTIMKIKPLIGTIPKLREDLEKLKRTKSPATTVAPVTKTSTKAPKGSQKPKRSADDGKKLEFQNPQDLLDVAISVRGLEIMDLILQYNNLIDTVIRQGALAENSISRIDNPSNKAELEKIWKDFGMMKTKLEAIKSNNQKLVDTVTSSGQETSLEDVGLVYRNLASLNPSERVFLRDLRLSMRLFERENKELMESLEKLEKPLATDWQMTHASFKRLPTAMQNLKKDFDKFFKVETGFMVTVKNNLSYFGGGAGVLVVLGAAMGSFFFFRKYIHDPELKMKPPVDNEPFVPTEEAMSKHYDFMQLQDSRLDMNKRNEADLTPMFKAYLDKDYDHMRELIEEGAIVDAVCGQYNRTLLLETANARDIRYCDLLLERDAELQIWDCYSKDVENYAVKHKFAVYVLDQKRAREKLKVRKRILPKTPRPWKILVLEASSFPLWKRKKLPHRIKACTKWGYTGEEFDEYTTIILPKRYVRVADDDDSVALIMDDADGMMKWKLVGCKAILTRVDFFHRLYKAHGYPEEVQEILNTDYRDWVLDMYSQKEVHEKALYRHKNRIHQMQPPLLQDVKIILMPTKNKKLMAKQKTWKENIRLFGGTIVDDPTVDELSNLPPYYAANPKYIEEGNHQNRTWILKYKDTDPELILKEWIDDWEHFTCADMEFLPQCIARCRLLPTNNSAVPLAYNDDKQGKGYLRAKEVQEEYTRKTLAMAAERDLEKWKKANGNKYGTTATTTTTQSTVESTTDSKANETKKAADTKKTSEKSGTEVEKATTKK
uniref:ANK_REP_REGION domain-containing protein n=1 Tax=Caenorhabditis tropicalis TaxID=1561998 RepID=A0A1I7UIB4_9PELO